MRLLTRATRLGVNGREETTYNLALFPIVISALAATGTFGNFFLNLGIHFKWF
jgi:hypothetical protein